MVVVTLKLGDDDEMMGSVVEQCSSFVMIMEEPWP